MYCPFCNSDNIEVRRMSKYDGKIECLDCCLQGEFPIESRIEGAEYAWVQR